MPNNRNKIYHPLTQLCHIDCWYLLHGLNYLILSVCLAVGADELSPTLNLGPRVIHNLFQGGNVTSETPTLQLVEGRSKGGDGVGIGISRSGGVPAGGVSDQGEQIQTYSITFKTRIKTTSKQDFKRNFTRDTSKSAINHQTIPLSLHLKMILENVNNNVGELVGQSLHWFTVKKIKKNTSYEFDLANKKCKVDVEQFSKILGICPRVPNEDFVVPLSEESLINFLYELGYKELANEIKKSEAYQAFIAYSTSLVPPKQTRVQSQHTAELSEEERHLHETHERLVIAKPTGVDEYDESDRDITWLSTDDEEKGNKDDDKDNDDRKKNVAKKLEEEKGNAEEEQANDDQAQEDQVEDDIVGTLVTMSQKEKTEVPRSSSSHSLCSNYGN
ncbi:hypothetical protein Tco_0499897 [Tanacetum coccineum]